MRIIGIARLLAMMTAACSTTTSGGSISGTIDGQTFTVTEVISAQIEQNIEAGATHPAAVVVLANVSHLCDEATAGHMPTGFRGLFLDSAIAVVPGMTFAVPTSGTYTVGGSSSDFAGAWSATCPNDTSLAVPMTSGTVTLTSVQGNVLDGHFDLTSSNGDTISGTFASEACPGLQNLVDAYGFPGSNPCQ